MKKNKIIIGITLLALIALLPLSVSAYDSFYEKLPKDKQELLDREQAVRDNASKTPKNKNATLKKIDKEAEKLQNDADFKRGIFDGEAPAGSHDVSIQNLWNGKLGNKYVVVYAGVLIENPEQGVLVYETRDEYLNTLSSEYIKSKTTGGTLKIVEEKGNKLTVVDAQGNSFIFDVDKKSLE